jgi:hypothetical protein
MEELTGKQKDVEIRKLLKDIPLEEPSPDFTSKVMSGIQKEALHLSTVYRPPIRPGIWVIIALLFGIVIVISLNSAPDSDMAWPSFMKLDFGPALSFLDKIASAGLSKTLSYGAVALALAIFVQLYLLKVQLDKRFSVS